MIVDMKKEILNLERIPCHLRMIEFTEKIGSVYNVDKVAIFIEGHGEDVKYLKEYEYRKEGVIMYQEQYNTIFKPLFDEIGRLNHQIIELQSKIK